jgi:hypothetical protein
VPRPSSSDIMSVARALRLGVFEFRWRAEEEAWLPRFKGSTIRGALGWAFKRVVCIRADGNCACCLVRSLCGYPYVFETPPPAEVPAFRGQRTAPHPYVLEPPLEEKEHYAPGEPLSFGLLLLGRALTYLPYLVVAVEQAGRRGLGRGRARFALDAVVAREVSGVSSRSGDPGGESRARSITIYDGSSGRITWNMEAASLEALIRERQLRLDRHVSHRVRLRVLTPVRVRIDGDLQADLPFDLLVRSVLRRLWQLALVHGENAPPFDPRPWIERACAVPTVRQALVWRDWERYSHRQRTKMRLGGVVGEIEYELREEDLVLFLPLLIIGELLHVGTATTFGLGKYEIRVSESPEKESRTTGSDLQ